MKAQIEKILNRPTFFKVAQTSKSSITANLMLPSQILLQNIHKSWLLSIYAKTHQHYPVYISELIAERSKKPNLCYGYIEQCLPDSITELDMELRSGDYSVKKNCELKFNCIILQRDVMQYFIQWQRYRKYWWSSVTTTPGLFSVIDMKYESDDTHANISANFDWGQQTVESIKIHPTKNASSKFTVLCCKISLQKSLLTLLMDAATDNRDEYLRLHTKIAPYKIAFALHHTDQSNVSILQELAAHIFYKLQASRISTWLPKFSLPLEAQIKENMQMGVPYTAILSEETLRNGIFHLINSSTMLKEQVHMADIVNYAAMLCGKQTLSENK